MPTNPLLSCAGLSLLFSSCCCRNRRRRCCTVQGRLCSLPLLLPGWQPDLGGLCDLVLGLARDVVWDEEQPCFRSLAQVRGRV